MGIENFLFTSPRNRTLAAQKNGSDLAKFAAKQYAWNVRRALVSSKARALPNFLIIGAQKGGTSSLYRNIVKHSQVVAAHRKEVNFFSHDTNFIRGLDWYRDHFPTSLYLAYSKYLRGRPLITGEGTPRYMFMPFVAERVAAVLPEARIIAILRDPVRRAYSHYHMAVRKNVESLPFEAAIEEARQEVHRLYSNGFAVPRVRADYLTRGIYVDQLQGWFEHFPREQILILASEEYYKGPDKTLETVFEFLGVPSTGMAPYKRGRVRERYPAMSEQARNELVEFFTPYNERLYTLLGRDFGWSR